MESKSRWVCLICEKQVPSNHFTRHLKRAHQMSDQEYYDHFLGDEFSGHCKVCGKPTEFQKLSRGYYVYCNLDCRKEDEELISNLSRTMSRSMVNLWKTDPEFRKRHSARMSKCLTDTLNNLWKDEEYREHMSEAGRLQMLKNHQDPIFYKKMIDAEKHGKSGWYESPKVGFDSEKGVPTWGRIHYRSSYELAAYQKLDLDLTVESYKAEPFFVVLPSGHKYYPDILVEYGDGTTEVIEVKPLVFVQDFKDIGKFDAITEYCKNVGWRFEIWTESEIFQ